MGRAGHFFEDHWGSVRHQSWLGAEHAAQRSNLARLSPEFGPGHSQEVDLGAEK